MSRLARVIRLKRRGKCYGHESAPCRVLDQRNCARGGGINQSQSCHSSGTDSVSLAWKASTKTGGSYNIYRAVGPLVGDGVIAMAD